MLRFTDIYAPSLRCCTTSRVMCMHQSNPLLLHCNINVYMHVCMYICMCIHACIHTYIGMYICMYACIYVCMYVYMYVRMYVCMYVCMYGSYMHTSVMISRAPSVSSPTKSIRADVNRMTITPNRKRRMCS